MFWYRDVVSRWSVVTSTTTALIDGTSGRYAVPGASTAWRSAPWEQVELLISLSGLVNQISVTGAIQVPLRLGAIAKRRLAHSFVGSLPRDRRCSRYNDHRLDLPAPYDVRTRSLDDESGHAPAIPSMRLRHIGTWSENQDPVLASPPAFEVFYSCAR